jgi:GntR family transcriptional regulator
MERLDICLDTASEIPAYRQVADQLRTFIVEGALQPGDTLPPVRRLAIELGVHFNTVAESYRLLAEQSFLEITRGHGARVIERAVPAFDPTGTEDFRRRLRQIITEVRARGMQTRQIAIELRITAASLEEQ